MNRKNDSINHPLRFQIDTRVVGQFYNSRDKTYHLAEYVPYSRPPTVYLCGKSGNFSPSGADHDRLKCEECWLGFDERWRSS